MVEPPASRSETPPRRHVVNSKSPLFAAKAPYAEPLTARSGLVRRLVRSHNDPADEQVRAWFCGMDDRRLHGFGLSPADILVLRGQASFLSG